MNACAYRSVEPVLVERIAALHERRAAGRSGIAAAERIAARRIAWAVAGLVGVASGGAAFLVALATYLSPFGGERSSDAWATGLLLGGWIAASLAGVLAAVIARAWLATQLDVEQTLSGDAATDLARVDASDPLRERRALAERWERASTALPLAAASLLAPLTLHWIVYSVMLGGVAHGLPSDLANFGQWMGMSVVLVGHAHVVFGLDVNRQWSIALGAAMGAACIPGLVLMAVPPVLVGATGLLFVPAMFFATARRLVRERTLLEAA